MTEVGGGTRASGRGRLSYTVVQAPGGAPPAAGGGGRTSAGGTLRVSVHGQDMKEVGQAPEQETLVDLFLSGRNSCKTEASSSPEEVEDLLEVELIADPPCIAAFEDEEDAKPKSATAEMEGLCPQEYWKAFAAWKRADPVYRGRAQKASEFMMTWAKKNNMEHLIAATGHETIQDLFKRQRTRSRQVTVTMKSGTALEACEGFVNISQHSIGIRKISSMAEDQKTGEVLEPGESVVVDRIQEKDDVRYLKLADGRGWVFDSHDGNPVMAKMEEIDVGNVWYRVVCKELIAVRAAPVYDEEAKTGTILSPKELVVVNIKCRVRGQHFVHLADGRGWVFLSKPGTKLKNRSVDSMTLEECDAEIVHGEAWMSGQDILPVTNSIVEVGLWTYSIAAETLLALGTKLHGVTLRSGDVIKVDKRCYSRGTTPEAGSKDVKWLRIMDGRGWVPEKTPEGKALVTLQSAGGISYPQTFKDKFEAEEKLPKWAIGLC